MELFQLKYFVCVAKQQSFSKAAEELLISQPSVSRAIQQLEHEFDLHLFERHGKHIKSTKAGEVLYEKLMTVIAILDDLPTELNIIAGKKQSTIVLNVLAATPLLPEILECFKQKHPNINLSLIQKEESSKFDLCLSSALPNIELKNAIPLLNEELKLAVPRTSPLAVAKTIDLAELRNEKFILLKNHSLRNIMTHYFDICGYSPKIAFETDNPYTVRELLRAGLGISLWPEVTWGKISDRARLLTITNPPCRRNIMVHLGNPSLSSPDISAFVDFLKAYFTALISKNR